VEDLLDLPLADDLADADVLAALDGDHQGEITVLRSDHEVFPAFSQEVSFSKVLDDCSAMFWMDYRVTLTEHTTTSPAGTRGRIACQSRTRECSLANQNRRSEAVFAVFPPVTGQITLPSPPPFVPPPRPPRPAERSPPGP